MTKMTEFKLSELDEEELMLGDEPEDPKLLAGIFTKMKPNQLYKVQFRSTSSTKMMETYIKRLQENGLKIGKGDAEFGYRMPLPENDAFNRYLVIFRRR